jgi:hypothetical protein
MPSTTTHRPASLTQGEFATLLSQLPDPPTPRLPKPKPGLNTATFTVALAAALQRHNLRAPLYTLLTAIGRLQATPAAHATIPQLAAQLACTFQAIAQHAAKHNDLIQTEKPPTGHALIRLTITAPAIRLLLQVQRTTRTIAAKL